MTGLWNWKIKHIYIPYISKVIFQPSHTKRAFLHSRHFANNWLRNVKMAAYSICRRQKKNFQSFAVICRKLHVASSICLRSTIFQNPEWTLWTHCIWKLNCLKVRSTMKLNYEPGDSRWLPQSIGQGHTPKQWKCTWGAAVLPDARKWNLVIRKITIRKIYIIFWIALSDLNLFIDGY
jgi:hypothetical protein